MFSEKGANYPKESITKYNTNILKEQAKTEKNEKKNNTEKKINIEKESSNKKFENNNANILNNNNININFNQQIPSQKLNNNNNSLNMNSSLIIRQYKNQPTVALKNVGNSTYMSAVLRILSNIRNIVNYYMSKKDIIKEKIQDIPLSYAFSRLLLHLYPKDDLEKEYSLEIFHNISINLNPIFKGNSTKNAIDYLVFVLNYLHKEDKIFKNQSNINDNKNNMQLQIKDLNSYFNYLKTYENSIIFNILGWINKKLKKCNSCSDVKTTYQYYFTFDLDIKKAVNNSIMNNKNHLCIYDCILYATQKETLYNLFCEKCNDKCVFESESSIYSCPNYFVFLLRLNDDNFETINKIKEYFNGIKIEENLNLNDIIKEKNIQKKNYSLIGMVTYCFDNINGINNIEYKAYCRSHIDNNWYKYENDEKYKISQIDKSELFDSTNLFPVILIYRAI